MLKAEHTKSNEARPIHVSAKLHKELTAYKSCVTQLFPNALLIPPKAGPSSANSLCQLFGHLYEAAGITGASSHSDRRWFITKLAHAGVSPKVIMTLAGHKSLARTQRYIDVNDKLMARAVEIL